MRISHHCSTDFAARLSELENCQLVDIKQETYEHFDAELLSVFGIYICAQSQGKLRNSFFSEKCACLNGNMGTNQLQNQPLCSSEKICPQSCFQSPFSCKYNWQLGPWRILFLFHEQQRNEMQLTPWSSSQLQHTGTPATREGVPSRDFSRLN